MNKLFFTFLFSLSLLVGCASRDKNTKESEHLYYHLQTVPHSLEGSLMLKKLSFSGVISEQVIAQIEFEKAALNAAMLSLTGLPLLQASWQQQQGITNFSSTVLDKTLFLRIMRDIQLIHWPVESIKQGLISPFDLIEHNDSNIYQRTVTAHNAPIILIEFNNGTIRLKNLAEGYELLVEQLND